MMIFGSRQIERESIISTRKVFNFTITSSNYYVESEK